MSWKGPLDADLGDEWVLTKQVRNPWGQVPLTAGGRSLPRRAEEYMSRMAAQQQAADPPSHRHHYVPRAYLREWSPDRKRIWTLDTTERTVKLLGINDVCVRDNFYRVNGSDGTPHNRVELLFRVADGELRRVQTLFNTLKDPETLAFDDLIALGVTMAIQRMRTAQQRRLRLQLNAWLMAQDPKFTDIDGGSDDPFKLAGIHTEMVFSAMWEAADVFTTRQIEIWDDPLGRIWTTDAPVMVPFNRNAGPGLLAAPVILWPVSPTRVVALTDDLVGEKAVIKEADSKKMGLVRRAAEQGRERRIFAAESSRSRLPAQKLFRRRTQMSLRCSRRTPDGVVIPAPGCCVEMSETFASGPHVNLCGGGLHQPAPTIGDYA